MTIETTLAVLLFVAVFLFAGQAHAATWRDERSVVSFGAGMATAYVFVHVLPELAVARVVFAEAASVRLRYEGIALYFLALAGFLVFYALEHLRRGLTETEREAHAFRFHLAGFSVYVFLTGYLLVHGLEEAVASTVLFAVAIGFHFLGIVHDLRSEHAAEYDRLGRYVLAGAAATGWGLALVFELGAGVVALVLAFISGAVIMNSAVMELPSEKVGRPRPFLAGGLLYGLVLIPFG